MTRDEPVWCGEVHRQNGSFGVHCFSLPGAEIVFRGAEKLRNAAGQAGSE